MFAMNLVEFITFPTTES